MVCKFEPFGPAGNPEDMWFVEIQQQKMIFQDVDVVRFEHQMQCYRRCLETH